MTSDKLAALNERLGEISDVAGAMSLLGWDQQTLMPKAGAQVRASRLGTLTKIYDQLFTDPALGELLDALSEDSNLGEPDSDDVRLVEVVRDDYRLNRLVPTDLKVALSDASNAGYMAWIEARNTSDFSILQSHLEEGVKLLKQEIEYVRAGDDRFTEDYDVLLHGYEPGLKSSEVTRVFKDLKNATVPLVAVVRERQDLVDDGVLHQDYSVAAQKESVLEMAKQLGFTEDSWRLDVTEHPFASKMAIDDIRITTRYYQNFFNPSWFGTMHEFGHGLYEHGISHDLERTPLNRGASMAFHESQSRMWENLIGRGRPFWDWAMPKVQATYPGQLGSVSADDMYRAVNRLQPSLIRVEADELTYNLHIILRYEIERDLFGGGLNVADLPEAWNARFKDMFGINVPNDAEGVLQDVHWGSGLFGYFSTYALGNVVSLQLWERIRKEIPTLDEQTSQGEFGELRSWLKENLHQHGRKFKPTDLLERIVGTPTFDAAPLIAYLTDKVHGLYGE